MSEGNGCLTKDEYFAAAGKLDRKRVDLPMLPGKHLFIRKITGRERDNFEQTNMDEREAGKGRNMRGRFVAMIACDANGSPLFPTAQDVHLLGDTNSELLDFIVDEGMAFCGMGKTAIEDAKKNLKATHVDVSSTASPDTSVAV